MSFVVVSPSMLEAAVSEITGIGSALSAANTAAAGATTDLVAAAADEVSVSIVALFAVRTRRNIGRSVPRQRHSTVSFCRR